MTAKEGDYRMKGTEKQVAWAKDIKAAWETALEDQKRFGQKVGAIAPFPQEVEDYVQAILNEDDAKVVIEKYNIQTRSTCRTHLIAELPEPLGDKVLDWEMGL